MDESGKSARKAINYETVKFNGAFFHFLFLAFIGFGKCKRRFGPEIQLSKSNDIMAFATHLDNCISL